MSMLPACDGPDVDPWIRFTWNTGDGAQHIDIPPTCQGDHGIWWQALQNPAFDYRRTYAPADQYLPGQTLLAAVADLSAIPMVLVCRHTSPAALVQLQQQLLDVVTLWSYTVSLYYGDPGQPDAALIGSFAAQPALPQWGDITPAYAQMCVATGSLSIPVNPAGAL